jgi:hypothetical protein
MYTPSLRLRVLAGPTPHILQALTWLYLAVVLVWGLLQVTLPLVVAAAAAADVHQVDQQALTSAACVPSPQLHLYHFHPPRVLLLATSAA